MSFLSSQICSLLRGGIAERGGVRVGHRIIEINNQSVVAVPHEKIVNLLATSVGEVSLLAASSSRTISNEFVSDFNENNANINVPTVNWPRESHLHLMSSQILAGMQ